MRKLLNNPWVVTGLALVAAALVGWSLYRQLHPDPVYLPSAAQEEAEPASEAPAAEATVAEGVRPLTLRAALLALVLPENPPDPFAPRAGELRPAVQAPPPEEPDLVETIVLSAIWSQGGALLVIVNGRICQAGDVVGRLRIESADLEGVWVSHWRGRDFLPLGGSFTLVTPARQAVEVSNLALHEG
jgi:hypothetical protein